MNTSRGRIPNRIKMNMERSRVLLPISLWLKSTRLVALFHTIERKVAGNRQHLLEKEFVSYYLQHKDAFKRVYDSLADKKSKITYKAFIHRVPPFEAVHGYKTGEKTASGGTGRIHRST